MTSLSLPPAPPSKVNPPAGIKLQPDRLSVSVSLPPSVFTVIFPVIDATGILTVFGSTCVVPAPAFKVLFGSLTMMFGGLHEIVSVSFVVPPFASVIVRLPLATATSVSGGVMTVIEAAAVLPVPPLVEVTLLVRLFLTPAVAPVTVGVTTQVPLPAIVAAESEITFEAIARVPPQADVEESGTVNPGGSVSAYPTPVSAVDGLGFVTVIVKTDV